MWDTHTQLRAYLADNAAATVMSPMFDMLDELLTCFTSC
jgi:hypothetical protein